MRVYLSGPMRGLPEANFPEFRKNAELLREAGHDVLDPSMSFTDRKLSRPEYLRHDIQLILCVDAVVVLDDWDLSPGARFEVAEAWQIGIPVYEMRVEGGEVILRQIEEGVVSIPKETQYLNNIPLIGLSGYAGVGKDEIAKILQQYGWKRIAFADPLKRIATALGWDGNKDEAGRRLLQSLGVAVRDELHSDAWVTRAEVDIEAAGRPVVLTDVRFPNELHMIRRRGGTVLRIERPGCGAANEHISEHAVGEADADLVFTNDCSLEELEDRLVVFLGAHGFPIRKRAA